MTSPSPQRSSYTVSVHGNLIALVDRDDGGRSVTNDAERVVEDLRRAGYDLERCRVISRDTLGTWDELVVELGRFVGFRPLRLRLLRFPRERDRARLAARVWRNDGLAPQ
jgi:hypothetical protein